MVDYLHACVSSRGAQSTELVSLYIGYWNLNNYYYNYYFTSRCVETVLSLVLLSCMLNDQPTDSVVLKAKLQQQMYT